MKRSLCVLAAASVAGSAGLASAGIRITEYMYSGNAGEFIEFTNLGDVAIDMTGWSYDDDSREPGALDLSAFGLVAPGESVVITEDLAESFAFSGAFPRASRSSASTPTTSGATTRSTSTTPAATLSTA